MAVRRKDLQYDRGVRNYPLVSDLNPQSVRYPTRPIGIHERRDDYIAEDNAVRVVDAFVVRLELPDSGFERAELQDFKQRIN